MQLATQLLGLHLSPNHTGWCFCETATPGNLTFGVHDLEKSPLAEIEKMDFILEWLKPMLQPGLLVLLENFGLLRPGPVRAPVGRAAIPGAASAFQERHIVPADYP